MIRPLVLVVAALFLTCASKAYPGTGESSGGPHEGTIFLWIAVILLAAKISQFLGRMGQPAVLGELLVGLVLGNLTLVGVHFFEPVMQSTVITFLADLGVVILLFQVGLESNLKEMLRVGPRAFAVALVGVIVPFLLGTMVVGPLLLPSLSFGAHLFLGAIFTATSVGIAARIFHDLGKLGTGEARIVLGAAVIDDILGLTILAVVRGIVELGYVSWIGVIWLIGKSFMFLILAVLFGHLFAGRLGQFLSRINPGIGMKFTLALGFGLVFAWAAEKIGLAPIVGAFAAGLALDPVHFRHFKNPTIVEEIFASLEKERPKVKTAVSGVLDSFSIHHVEDLIQPLAYFLVPIFFVLTGMSVRLETLFDLQVLLLALSCFVAAFGGKFVSGWAAGAVNKSIVGWGMVPRGEVGLIFAAMGRVMGVLPEEVFSMVVIVIILTTLFPPPVLQYLLKRHDVKPLRPVRLSG